MLDFQIVITAELKRRSSRAIIFRIYSKCRLNRGFSNPHQQREQGLEVSRAKEDSTREGLLFLVAATQYDGGVKSRSQRFRLGKIEIDLQTLTEADGCYGKDNNLNRLNLLRSAGSTFEV